MKESTGPIGPAIVQALLIIGGVVAIAQSPVLGVALAFVWLLPIVIGISLGLSRGRTGWMWGLFLSWLGVLILACMRPLPPLENPES